MDTLLAQGDHWTDGRGLPVKIEGDEELLQRALIRLHVRRGALPAEPTLGSDLYKLHTGSEQLLERLARSYVQEALAPLGELRVRAVIVAEQRDGTLAVQVGVARQNRAYELEVLVN